MNPETTPRVDAAQYLTFQIATGEYGCGLLRVREILQVAPITAVPRAPVDEPNALRRPFQTGSVTLSASFVAPRLNASVAPETSAIFFTSRPPSSVAFPAIAPVAAPPTVLKAR